MKLSKEQISYLGQARVARLGTTDSDGRVHIVPIVFANTSNEIFSVIDRKAKKSQTNLKRLENIAKNPSATLLIDSYSEDWSKLSFLLIHCKARILWPGKNLKEKRLASRLLRKKYAQYTRGQYFPPDLKKAVFVKLSPKRVIFWQESHHSLG